jgi:hypothetical protein
MAGQNRTEINALLIQKELRRSLPMTKAELCSKLGISEGDFNQAISYSRRNDDPSRLANEVICVTNSHPFVYFLAKNYDEADKYTKQRAKLADGHLYSVQMLLVKEAAKYPAKGRDIGIFLRTVTRMREDIAILLDG